MAEHTFLDVATWATYGRIYGPRGEVVHRYEIPDALTKVVEALSQRSQFLQDVPWKRRISPILQENGKHYLMEMP